MPILYYFVFWVVVTFCQVVIVPRLAVLGVFPDIMLAAVVLIGLRKGRLAGLWFGFALAISVDLLDPQKLGWMTLLVSLTGYVAGVIRETLYIENPWFEVTMVFLATFLYQIFYRMLPEPQFFMGNLFMMLADSFFIAIYTFAMAGIGIWLIRQKYRLRDFV